MTTPDQSSPESPALRYPNLPENHPLNIIDPDSDVPPVFQIDRYRRTHPQRRPTR